MGEDYLEAVLGEIMANALRWSGGELSGADFVEQTRGMLKTVMVVCSNHGNSTSEFNKDYDK